MTETDSTDDIDFSRFVLDYELALREQDREHWYEATVNVIDSLYKYFGRRGLAELGVNVAMREHWYTRLASALTKYIVDPTTTLNLEQLSAVCRRKQIVAYIFNASGFRNMRHILPLLGKQSGPDITLPVDRLAVFYAFVGLDDINDDLMQIALRQPPDLLVDLMLGWLNQRAILTKRGEDNRSMLLAAGSQIEAAKISDTNIEQVVNAWMYSSYASAPYKHDIKKSFNSLLKRLMLDAGIRPGPSAEPTASKPKILVVHERFLEQHAMYRCYAQSIRKLRQHFDLVALAEADWIDAASDDIFDSVIRIEDKVKNIAGLVRLIQSHSPQLIYYPSLGMSHWTVMLAQLRLAPIQVMSHGHPGTSMSDEIDYAYICEIEGDIAAIHSEKLLLGGKYVNFSPHTDLPESLPELIEPSHREVRVAVNSKVMKLSHRLLEICKKLAEQSEVPVRFSFFPGERGIFFDGLVPAIKSILPDASVMPYVNYDDFLNEMCKCDLALAAFPFGNTNSTVDTCLLGLPTLAHFGPESPAQSDKLVLTTAGFPEWLVAHSDEEYFEKALRLINDRVFREDLVGKLSRESVRTRLFGDYNEERTDPFADVMLAVYNHHEELMNQEKRVFHHSELKEMLAM